MHLPKSSLKISPPEHLHHPGSLGAKLRKSGGGNSGPGKGIQDGNALSRDVQVPQDWLHFHSKLHRPLLQRKNSIMARQVRHEHILKAISTGNKLKTAQIAFSREKNFENLYLRAGRSGMHTTRTTTSCKSHSSGGERATGETGGRVSAAELPLITQHAAITSA